MLFAGFQVLLFIQFFSFFLSVKGKMYNYIYTHLCLKTCNAKQLIYRGTGFKCEHVIIANCDFSPSAQLLERNI